MGFKERRGDILSVFNKAKTDLENLNKEIDAALNLNKETIKDIKAEITELKTLRNKNKISIKVFSKIFKG